MQSLDVFLISLVSIFLYSLADKHIFSKTKPKRYFYFAVNEEKYRKYSGYILGTEKLNSFISSFTKQYGYGIDFTVREVTKEEFESVKDKNHKQKSDSNSES